MESKQLLRHAWPLKLTRRKKHCCHVTITKCCILIASSICSASRGALADRVALELMRLQLGAGFPWIRHHYDAGARHAGPRSLPVVAESAPSSSDSSMSHLPLPGSPQPYGIIRTRRSREGGHGGMMVWQRLADKYALTNTSVTAQGVTADGPRHGA